MSHVCKDIVEIGNPLVSVVMPVFNGERFLSESINSVLNQTYRNFELIIWDDGSYDKTRDIIELYRDKRIRYFFHDNEGLGKALALACQKACGKYIARIDCDDICMPYRLQKQVDFLESHSDYCLVSSSVYYIDENGCVVGRSFPWTWNVNIKKRNNIVHPASMFRKDIYDRTGGYLNLKLLEDKNLWARMAGYGKFKNFKEPLIKYRLLSYSMSHSFNPQNRYYRDFLTIKNKILVADLPSEADIEEFNRIFSEIRKENKVKIKYCHKVSTQERIFNLLSILLGRSISESILYLLTNLYAFFRY